MLKKVLENLKIAQLNEMQLASIKAFKQEGDLVLLSPTGSGKTLGFLLPVLEKLNPDVTGVQALVLAPSRELALQIEKVFRSMGTGFKVNCCYGGHSMKTEKNNLEFPPALLIGTPGRIHAHLRENRVDTTSIRILILDEFDKALEMGFQDDMSAIIELLPKLKKRILISATNAQEIPSFTGITNPVTLNYLSDVAPKGLKVKAVQSEGTDKLETLFSLICKLGNKGTLVFCNHRDAVERISDLLGDYGLIHDIFHGGMEQEDRERALIKFRNGSHHLLITTDLAARGLDIPEIENIIHYQLPPQESAFIHRNGRTARMHAEGTSYLVLSKDEPQPEYIKEKLKMEELPAKNILPEKSKWATLYIAAGKKEKISKGDVVGLLIQKGKLLKDELGLIEVQDHATYAAVRRDKIQNLIHDLRNEKIKNKKVKIDISK
ncbi:MAG: DEAD/DEAH box helicase [Bacteroidetes bacterium]|nr:DEAD/DEAH box helicase [Bacteroidota bacterium]